MARILDSGVYPSPASFYADFMSAAHSPDDIDRIVAVAGQSMRAIGQPGRPVS
jgi:glutamate-1-semialdehyde aminotransferase